MTIKQFKNWLDDGDTKSRLEPQVSRYAAQLEFAWNEAQHPRESTSHDGKGPGSLRLRVVMAI